MLQGEQDEHPEFARSTSVLVRTGYDLRKARRGSGELPRDSGMKRPTWHTIRVLFHRCHDDRFRVRGRTARPRALAQARQLAHIKRRLPRGCYPPPQRSLHAGKGTRQSVRWDHRAHPEF